MLHIVPTRFRLLLFVLSIGTIAGLFWVVDGGGTPLWAAAAARDVGSVSAAPAASPFAAETPPGPAQEPATASGSTASGRTVYTVDDPDAYTYTVRPADSWYAIAKRFDVSFGELRETNQPLWSLRGAIIRPGDEMAIPGRTAEQMPATTAYTVQAGDSWSSIADEFGVSSWDLRLDNPRIWHRRGVYIRPGDMLTVHGTVADEALEEAVSEAGGGEESSAESDSAESDGAEPDSAESDGAVAEADADAGRDEAADESTAEAADDGSEDAAEESTDEAGAGDAEEAAGEGIEEDAVADSPEESGQEPVTQEPIQESGGPILVVDPPGDGEIYTVRPGDSWYGIAAARGVTFLDLRTANPALWAARGQNIRVGDQMVIPDLGSPPPPMEIRTAPDEEEPGGEVTEEDASVPDDAPADGTPEPVEEAADDPTDPSGTQDEGSAAPADDQEGAGEDGATTPAAADDSTSDAAEGSDTAAGDGSDLQATEDAVSAEPARVRVIGVDVASGDRIYTVRAGETWASLARQFGVSVEALQAANPAVAAAGPAAGDVIRLP